MDSLLITIIADELGVDELRDALLPFSLLRGEA
jgi:hypothetical protein